MKLYFTTPIMSLKGAHAYLRRLHEDGLLYHPDDDASTIVRPDGRYLFVTEDVIHLNQRMAEVFSFDPDPCAFIIEELR